MPSVPLVMFTMCGDVIAKSSANILPPKAIIFEIEGMKKARPAQKMSAIRNLDELCGLS